MLIGKELSYLHGKSYFDEDGAENYYIFQPISKYLKVANINNIYYILWRKSRGLNDIKIESIKTNNVNLSPPCVNATSAPPCTIGLICAWIFMIRVK